MIFSLTQISFKSLSNLITKKKVYLIFLNKSLSKF